MRHSILITLCLSIWSMLRINGQLCNECEDCNDNFALCSGEVGRCRFLTGSAVNPNNPSPGSGVCVEIGTCDSDCTLCPDTAAGCTDGSTGSAANCFISGVSGECVGGDCETDCFNCDDPATAEDDCNNSGAEPNGCSFVGSPGSETCEANTKNPTFDPTEMPSMNPTINPTTGNPTPQPTDYPTTDPTIDPTFGPTFFPTSNPTSIPTSNPSTDPTSKPSTNPTTNPTSNPSSNPTAMPTSNPSTNPTSNPTFFPTSNPTDNPSENPTSDPTMNPTEVTSMPTMNPTMNPVDTPECPSCPLDVDLISVGNITIEPCPVENDCDCQDGLTSIVFTYIGDSDPVDITITNGGGTTTFCDFSAVSSGDELICTIDTVATGLSRFSRTTAFTITYEDDTECSGTFDTDCSEDILGAFGTGCRELVVTEWTDIAGGVCTGNVSLIPPSTTEEAADEPEEESSSSIADFWRFRDGSKSSSSRRRILSSSSSSGITFEDEAEAITGSWYTNKKCVASCAAWGAQQGLTCGCYQSCTAGALNASCYEGNTAGYCGTGVCCCGGQCLLEDACDYGVGSSSSSSSSDGRRRILGSNRCYGSSSSSSSGATQFDANDGYYSYSEWYADKCSIDVEDEDDDCFGAGSSSSSSSDGRRRRLGSGGCGGSSSSSRRRRRRRRQLLGGSFGSSRKLMSSSSSSSSSGVFTEDEANINAAHDYKNEFLVETCLTYRISGLDLAPDGCYEIISVFLPLCENNLTDFNSSNLNASDLTGLITDETFEAGTNVISAEGTTVDGQLGILVVINNNTNATETIEFELCLGNVTVNAQNVDTLNATTIETAMPGAFINVRTDNGTRRQCGATDGLPCLNFFFDAPCPSDDEEEDEVYRSCDCDDLEDVASILLTYLGDETVIVNITRKKYGDGDVLLSELVDTEGDEISLAIADTDYDEFKKSTGVVVLMENGTELCVGRIKPCRADWIEEQRVQGCEEYLNFTSFTTTDGALCDRIAARQDSSSDSADDALVIAEQGEVNPFKVFDEMDPSTRYMLIGIMVTFAGLMLVACYICYQVNKNKDDEFEEEENAGVTLKRSMKSQIEMHSNSDFGKAFSASSTLKDRAKGRDNNKETDGDQGEDDEEFEDEYYDEENAQMNDGQKEKAMAVIEEVDDDDDEYFDGDIDVQPAMDIKEDDVEEDDEYYDEDDIMVAMEDNDQGGSGGFAE